MIMYMKLHQTSENQQKMSNKRKIGIAILLAAPDEQYVAVRSAFRLHRDSAIYPAAQCMTGAGI